MAEATNAQIQKFCDGQVRPHSELARSVVTAFTNDIALIGDIYENLTTSPDWVDANADNLPHAATAADILAWNTFITGIRDAIINNAQWPVIQKLCRSA